MHPLLARWLYFTAQNFRGEPVGRVLREMEASTRSSEAERSALQWERQRALVRHCYERVPYYRDRWRAAGFAPEDLRSPADWQRLPLLEKADLQQHAAEMTAAGKPQGLKSATSGSAGTPVAVLRSHLSWAHTHANLIRFWRWHGLDVGDRYAYFWGLALDREGRQQAGAKDAFFNRERFSAFDLDPRAAIACYRRLLKRPARFAFGYPSALSHFAHEIAAQGFDGRALGWKAVVTSAEVLRPLQRETITASFGCPVHDVYGCAEVGIAGMDCGQGRLHVPVESVVVDLHRLPDGSRELLLTDLHNFSQPVLRYRVGDVVEPAAVGCGCGLGLPELGIIAGRGGDTLTLPDGRRVNANLPSYVFKHHGKEGTVREYQFVQFGDGRIELRVTTGPAWRPETADRLRAEVREVLGIEVDLRILPRFERVGRGKHRDFVRADEIGEAGRSGVRSGGGPAADDVA